MKVHTHPLLLIPLLMGAHTAKAQETTASSLPPMQVLGSQDAILQQVGSSAFLSREDIQIQNDFNVNRLLQRVPGVYVREEDGFGNFPNISLRGSDGTRMEKTTVMEDGILTAPAPYSAPGAYYSPAAGRMSGLEVLKGSSQVRFGPHTTGGALNYLSTPVPDTSTSTLRMTYGEWNTWSGHFTTGGSSITEKGRLGALFELYTHHSEGFRELNHATGDTGFSRYEPMVKLFWEPVSAVPQRFEFKIGHTDFSANETYLGLSEADLRDHPHRRYPATRFDNIDTEQIRTYLRYVAGTLDGLQLESTAYYNLFERNWFKSDHVSTERNPVLSSSGSIVSRTSLHQALLNRNNTLGVLRDDAPGSIGVKSNNREYAGYGWQNELRKRLHADDTEHTLRAGLRIHHDYEDRFQHTDVFSGPGDGSYSLFRKGLPGEDADRRQETTATALFVEDEIRRGPLTLKPGLRWEHLEQRAENRGKAVEGDLDTWAAGLGLALDLAPGDVLFGGVYRGVALPGPDSHLNSGIREEESLSTELGLRHRRDTHTLEFAGFFTDYSNLIGTDNGFGLDLGGGSNLNAGEAEVYGLEGQLSSELLRHDQFRLPAYLSVTWTRAELKNALATSGGNNIFAGGEAGADLPYVPEWKLAFGLAVEHGPYSLRLDGTWVDETFGTARNLDAPQSSSREGRIDDALVLDLGAGWQVSETLRLFAGVRNLLDETYLASRLPEGPRSGAPRQAYAGFDIAW